MTDIQSRVYVCMYVCMYVSMYLCITESWSGLICFGGGGGGFPLIWNIYVSLSTWSLVCIN